MSLKKALTQVKKQWTKAYLRAFEVTPSHCKLCDLVKGYCEDCVAQKLCNASSHEPLPACYNGKRTLYGKIMDAENDLAGLILEAIKELDKLVKEA